MATHIIDDVALILCSAREPRDEEWEATLSFYRSHARSLRALFVYSLGGGPNGKQRAELAKLFETAEHLPATYVITSSVIVRRIGTAINWFLPAAKRANMYDLDQLELAIEAAQLKPATRAELKRRIELGQQLLATGSD